ncbi:hypothetical protein D3C84_1035120 [compost metagenome]
MIAIINTGETDDQGRACYRLQINHKLIAEFAHLRVDGLAACLRLAADAADRAHFEQVDRALKLAEDKPDGL